MGAVDIVKESFANAKLLPAVEQRGSVSLDKWRDDLDVHGPTVENLISDRLNPNRDADTQAWLFATTGYNSVQEMKAENFTFDHLSPQDRKNGRAQNIDLNGKIALVDQMAYIALQKEGYIDGVMTPLDFDNLLPGPLRGCGDEISFYGVGNDQIRGMLARTDLEYASTRFNTRHDITGYIGYLNSQMDAVAHVDGNDPDLVREKQSVGVYYAQRIAKANEILGRLERPEPVYFGTKDEQLAQMRKAMRVLEILQKAPGEGLEIMDQTVIINAFRLEAAENNSRVHPDVMAELVFRIKNLVMYKTLVIPMGFMPADRQPMDIVSAVERLRSGGDLLGYKDIHFAFGGQAEENGLPIQKVWNERQKLDFGTAYEKMLLEMCQPANYLRIQNSDQVELLFSRNGVDRTSMTMPAELAMFRTLLLRNIEIDDINPSTGLVIGKKFARPTDGVPLFADRGQTFSEDTWVLRTDVAKLYLELEISEAAFAASGLPIANKADFLDDFKDIYGQTYEIVNLLRLSTFEDIRARINLEGHNSLWELCSGILNSLDRAGKFKPTPDLYQSAMKMINMGAPWMCYVMHHDIYSPLLANEIDPRAFSEAKMDISYWSAWIKTVAKLIDFVQNPDDRSVAATIMGMDDALSKMLKGPASTTMTMNGVPTIVDNYKRNAANVIEIDDLGRRIIDTKKNADIREGFKRGLVRQGFVTFLKAYDITKEVEPLKKSCLAFVEQLTQGFFTSIEFGSRPVLATEQPTYKQILGQANEMIKSTTFKSKSFMSVNEAVELYMAVVGEAKFEGEMRDAALKLFEGFSGLKKK